MVRQRSEHKLDFGGMISAARSFIAFGRHGGSIVELIAEQRRTTGCALHLQPLPGAEGDELVARQVLRGAFGLLVGAARIDRKSTRLNSSHLGISYAVF